jgi:hypothetical protein
MLYLYKQSETVADRQKVYLHLVSISDGLTPATNEAGGQPQLIKNGGTPVNTTNTLVAVDTTNAPGLYYVQLTSAELGSLGFIAVRYKSSNTAEFQTVGQVILDDPYVAHTGPGLSLPSGKGGGKAVADHLYREDMIEIAKMVWDVKIREQETAKSVLLAKSEFDPVKTPITVPDNSAVVLEAIKSLNMTEQLEDQHEAVLEAIERKEQKDYSASISAIAAEVSDITIKLNALLAKESELPEIRELTGKLVPKLEKTQAELNSAAGLVAELKDQFDTLTAKVDDLSDQLTEEIDIEKRMERVGNKVQDKAVLEMVDSLNEVKKELNATGKKLYVAILDARLDIKTLTAR